LPGLDEFYKYIEKQEKQQTTAGREPEAVIVEERAPEKESDAGRNGIGKSNGTGKHGNGVRYVLRSGMTVAVEADGIGENAPAHPNGASVPMTNGASGNGPVGAAPAGTTLDDTVAMWGKLPRHIQLLASIEVPDREEVAQKYYTRGFRESRQQLIERLLNPTLTLEETARVLGVCPATVRRYTNRGVLPHYRTVGQQRRFRLSDVLTFLEQQQNERGNGGSGGRVSRRDAE
jgi:excisionase family DNA binding protein